MREGRGESQDKGVSSRTAQAPGSEICLILSRSMPRVVETELPSFALLIFLKVGFQ